MDEEKREKEKREKAHASEITKDRFKAFFAELRNMLQTHGYPVKGSRAKASQSTTALPQAEEETSTEVSAWIPSLQSYEDFNRITLQSIDGFMIILSADGVIIYVADNISSLLGYSPDEVVGKKLLSLLPDVEKSEVYGKIALKHPLSSSVGRHIEFCCHFRRGDIQCGGIITYEYVKFILGIKDISNEPLMLFTTFFPSQPYNELYGANLPLEDRFYFVGSVCVLRPEVLRAFFTSKEISEDIQPAQDLDEDEEYQAEEGRYLQGQRSSQKKAVCAELEASAEDDQIDTVTVDQYAPQDSTNVISIDSDTPTDSSASLNTIPDSPATSSLQSFQLEPEMEQMDEVNDTEEVEEKEDLDQMREMEDTEQPLQLSSRVTPHISRHELELMKKFTKQLDERTRRLQVDLTSQRSALEVMKQQLQVMQDHLPASCRAESPELQTFEPVPKKQVKRSRSNHSDLRKVKHFCGSSSHSVKISEELENLREQQMEEEELPELQMEEQYMDEEKLLEQQMEEERLPEQDMDEEKLAEQKTQHKVMPVNLVAEPPPSDCYQDESLGDQDGALSSLPEAQQESSLTVLSVVPHSHPGTISSSSFPQSPISSDSNTFPLETPQEYLAEPQPQHRQVSPWPSCEQVTLQDQTTQLQVQHPCPSAPQHRHKPPAGRARGSPEPEAFQKTADPLPDPESIFEPGELSDMDEQQLFTDLEWKK